MVCIMLLLQHGEYQGKSKSTIVFVHFLVNIFSSQLFCIFWIGFLYDLLKFQSLVYLEKQQRDKHNHYLAQKYTLEATAK